MACGFTAINQQSDPSSCGGVGGLAYSYAIPCTDFTSVTIGDDGSGNDLITAITLASTKSFVKIVPDDDKTAFYNQEGSRDGKKLTITQSSFMKFNTLTAAKINASNDAAECCCAVFIHVLNSGIRLMQGIDKTSTGFELSLVSPLVTPNILSDTAENEERVEWNIESEGRLYSIPVDPTINLDTLVGA